MKLLFKYIFLSFSFSFLLADGTFSREVIVPSGFEFTCGEQNIKTLANFVENKTCYENSGCSIWGRAFFDGTKEATLASVKEAKDFCGFWQNYHGTVGMMEEIVECESEPPAGYSILESSLEFDECMSAVRAYDKDRNAGYYDEHGNKYVTLTCYTDACVDPLKYYDLMAYKIRPTCPLHTEYNEEEQKCEADEGYKCPYHGCNSKFPPEKIGGSDNNSTGDNNANDPAPENPDVNTGTNSSDLPDTTSDQCQFYQPYREDFSDTGWIILGDFQAQNYDASWFNQYYYEGLNRYVVRLDKLTCKPDFLGYVRMCPSGKFYDSIKGYCSSLNDAPEECVETSRFEILKDGDSCYKEFYCESGEPYAQEVTDCPDSDGDGVIDDNITTKTNSQDIVDSLTLYGAATKINQENIKNELEQQTQILNSVDSSVTLVNSKLSNTNTKLDELINATNNQDNTVLNNIADKIDNSNLKLDALVSSNANIVENTAATNTKLDDLISAINDLNVSVNINSSAEDTSGEDTSDTNTSSNDGIPQNDLDTLNSSFDSLDDLITDFISFSDNLKSDLTTVQTSFDNAESLFKDGNLQLQSTSSISSCPTTTELMGQSYTLDLCEIVQPFSNVVYTLFYMLGFFGILITFIYIFILKGVD